jgi:hypothetical protein
MMVTAVALRDEGTLAQQAPTQGRAEVLARYRHLRAISKRHHANVFDFLSKDAIVHHGRRLGMVDGRTFILDSMDDLTLALDLAIHTAPAGRSRAIDRYARSAQLAPGSDETAVLRGMCNARFAVVSVQRRHPAAGLIVTDLFRKIDVWLVDEGLEISIPEGTALATRYYTPEHFAMTAGVAMPVDDDILTRALDSAPHLRRKSHVEALEDRRFAEAVYRVGIAAGITRRMAYQDLGGTDDVE